MNATDGACATHDLCNGGVEATFTSLPYGDAQTQTSGSYDMDQHHFAQTDYDAETNTDHAEFRQYSPAQGRWMRLDFYAGSYDISNPQSLNRYEYALDNPVSNIDPSGLDCITVDEDGNFLNANPGDCPGTDPENEYYVNCDGCTNGIWSATLTDNGGISFSGLEGSYLADGNGDYIPTGTTAVATSLLPVFPSTTFIPDQFQIAFLAFNSAAQASMLPQAVNTGNNGNYVSVLSPNRAQYDHQQCRAGAVLTTVGAVGTVGAGVLTAAYWPELKAADLFTAGHATTLLFSAPLMAVGGGTSMMIQYCGAN